MLHISSIRLASCIREKEWAFQPFIIRSLAQTSPRDFIPNSVKLVGVSLLWINTQVRNQKGVTEIIRKTNWIFLRYFENVQSFFQWNKGRSFIMVWSFLFIFNFCFWVIPTPVDLLLTFYHWKIRGGTGLGMNDPSTLKIRSGLKVGNQPPPLFFFCFSLYNQKKKKKSIRVGHFSHCKKRLNKKCHTNWHCVKLFHGSCERIWCWSDLVNFLSDTIAREVPTAENKTSKIPRILHLPKHKTWTAFSCWRCAFHSGRQGWSYTSSWFRLVLLSVF